MREENNWMETMIKNKIDLKKCLYTEKKLYLGDMKLITQIKLGSHADHKYLLWKYMKALRYTEFYYNKNKGLLYYYWQRKKNILGYKLGITMWQNTVDEGLRIWHYGSIVINGHAKIGKNCQLHGNNCIGNKGIDDDMNAPTIGDNVDIGYGAVIIGNIFIANNVTIGANAVVNKSCYQEGAILVGVPAKQVASYGGSSKVL